MRTFAAVRIPLLVATLPGLLVGAALANPHPALETVAPRNPRMLRAMWMLLIVLASTCVVTASLGGTDGETTVMVRNVLFGLGLTAGSAVVMPATISWGPLGAYTGAVFIYGTVDSVATPRWWALLQQPPGTPATLAVALAVAVLGCSLWIWRGSRSSAR